MACVVFTVDERLSGRPHVSNDAVLDFAAANSDIALPFVSIDPTRGEDAVREARRLVATGRVRGLKLHPPQSSSFPMIGSPTALRGVRGAAAARSVPHRPQRHRGGGAWWGWRPAQVRPPDADRRCGCGFPGHADHHGPPFLSMAGGGHLRLSPQAPGLHRPLGLVPEVFSAHPGPVREHASQAQGALRIGLSLSHPGSMDGRFREDRDPRGCATPDPQGERRTPARSRCRFPTSSRCAPGDGQPPVQHTATTPRTALSDTTRFKRWPQTEVPGGFHGLDSVRPCVAGCGGPAASGFCCGAGSRHGNHCRNGEGCQRRRAAGGHRRGDQSRTHRRQPFGDDR